MAWTDPPDFSAGGTALASDMDIISADLEYLKGIADGVTFSGVQVSRSTNQSIPDDTLTAVSWTTETFDYGGWWSSGTGITVPAGAIPDGYTSIAVHVDAAITYASNGTGYRSIKVYVNGAQVGPMRNTSAINGETTDLGITRYAVVEAGDVISIQSAQTSGGALNITKADISVVRFAPAS